VIIRPKNRQNIALEVGYYNLKYLKTFDMKMVQKKYQSFGKNILNLKQVR